MGSISHFLWHILTTYSQSLRLNSVLSLLWPAVTGSVSRMVLCCLQQTGYSAFIETENRAGGLEPAVNERHASWCVIWLHSVVTQLYISINQTLKVMNVVYNICPFSSVDCVGLLSLQEPSFKKEVQSIAAFHHSTSRYFHFHLLMYHFLNIICRSISGHLSSKCLLDLMFSQQWQCSASLKFHVFLT
jgi:hypothetical protein